MTFNICNLGSKYPYFNRDYIVSSSFGCMHLYLQSIGMLLTASIASGLSKKCFQVNLSWKRKSQRDFLASAFISWSRPSAWTSKMALASKTFSLMSFFNLGFNWKNFSFTLVPFFLTLFYNNFDNKILLLVKKDLSLSRKLCQKTTLEGNCNNHFLINLYS